MKKKLSDNQARPATPNANVRKLSSFPLAERIALTEQIIEFLEDLRLSMLLEGVNLDFDKKPEHKTGGEA